MPIEFEYYEDGGLDDPGPKHEVWCDTILKGPKAECDCGVDDRARS